MSSNLIELTALYDLRDIRLGMQNDRISTNAQKSIYQDVFTRNNYLTDAQQEILRYKEPPAGYARAGIEGKKFKYIPPGYTPELLDPNFPSKVPEKERKINLDIENIANRINEKNIQLDNVRREYAETENRVNSGVIGDVTPQVLSNIREKQADIVSEINNLTLKQRNLLAEKDDLKDLKLEEDGERAVIIRNNKEKTKVYSDELNTLNNNAFNVEKFVGEDEAEYLNRLQRNAEVEFTDDLMYFNMVEIRKDFVNKMKEKLVRDEATIYNFAKLIDPNFQVDNQLILLKNWAAFEDRVFKSFGKHNKYIKDKDLVIIANLLLNELKIKQTEQGFPVDVQKANWDGRTINPIGLSSGEGADNSIAHIAAGIDKLENKEREIDDEININNAIAGDELNNINSRTPRGVRNKPRKIKKEKNEQEKKKLKNFFKEDIKTHNYPRDLFFDNAPNNSKDYSQLNARGREEVEIRFERKNKLNINEESESESEEESPSFERNVPSKSTTPALEGTGLHIEHVPERAKFGKFIILPHKLFYDNILSIRDHRYKWVIGWKNAKVSDEFVKIIMDILKNKFPSKADVHMLNSGEKQLYDRLIKFSELHKHAHNSVHETAAKLKQELEVLEGEIKAGNTNEEIKHKINNVLQGLVEVKCITSNEKAKYIKSLK